MTNGETSAQLQFVVLVSSLIRHSTLVLRHFTLRFSPQMKTLGIIGGLGPESTLDYYQRIIALYRERMRDGHYPEFIIASIDLRRGLDFMETGDLSSMADFLLEAIGKLARAGAEFGII